MDVQAVLRDAQLVAYVGLAILAVRVWMRHRAAATAWAAMTFAALATIVVVGRVLPEDDASIWAVKSLILLLVLFPYALFRFMSALSPPSRRMSRAAVLVTAALAVWTVALPAFPAPGDRPGWFTAYVVGFLMQWTSLALVVTVRMWRAGRSEPTVARRRMQVLSLAAPGLALALAISGLAPPDRSPAIETAVSLLGLLAAVLFYLGLAPPKMLRMVWRLPESDAARDAIADLMAATTEEDVTGILLPQVRTLLGGRSAILLGRDGRVVAADGPEPESSASDLLRPRDANGNGDHPQLLPSEIRTRLRSGTLVVWASPFTPLFGGEELELARAMATLGDVALERVAAHEQERRFIADASHEMRTPLTAISGLAQTLASKHEEMSPARLAQVVEALSRQGERARDLIQNLLELSRMSHVGEAEVSRVSVEEAVRHALESAPPPAHVAVRVDVDQAAAVMANPLQLGQILVNLLSNAYRYGGSAVTLAASHADGKTVLEVCDDGPGVEPELLPRLFEPFARGRSVATLPGSGLGLTISRRLAEGLGAELDHVPVEPTGSCFRLILRTAS